MNRTISNRAARRTSCRVARRTHDAPLGIATVVLLLAGVGACSPAQNGTIDGGRPSQVVVDAESHVAMQRFPCFGTCPVYSVRIDADGTVTFNGERFVESIGTSTGAIDSSAAVALMESLVEAGIHEMADSYTHDAKECGPYHTDAPRVILTLRTSGRSKTVEHDHGCGDAPDALRRMQERVDSVAGVARWVGSSGRE
jgi:hypothetical protein